MGSSASCDDSVSVSIGFRSCLYSPNSKELWLKHEKSSYGNVENVKEIILDDLDSLTSEENEDFKDSVEENVKEIFLEDLDSSTSEEDEEKESIVKGLGISLCETLQIRDPPEPSYVRNSALNMENKCSQLKAKPLSLDTDVLEGLSKHATILCSEPVQSYLANSDAGDGFSCVTVQSENSSEDENLAFVQPLLKITMHIPALKGSRAKHGKHLNVRLSVKWAPEVYDPPVTASSHTVKGNQCRRRRHHHHHLHHRAKAKKDQHNQKYIKGKSPKGTVTERKHSHHGSNITDPRILSLQVLGCSPPQPLPNSCGQSKIESMDSAVGSHEAIKYGSSCYMEPLAPVQLPLTKAS